MIPFSKIEPGMRLWDSRRTKMGNTNISRLSAWSVRIISVDHEADTAVVSWNSNPPETWHKHRLEKLRRIAPLVKQPIPKPCGTCKVEQPLLKCSSCGRTRCAACHKASPCCGPI